MPIQIDIGGPAKDKPQAKPAATGPVVGIDLGTTNSLVANVEGSARVLHAEGESPLVPSAVAVGADGSFSAVGFEALAQRSKDARRVLYSVKRLMGRSLQDLGAEAGQIPYELAGDKIGAQVQIRVDERSFSPIEISAEILRALKKRAERELKEPVQRAVITVPAYFDDAQRTATKAAGRLAGLEVLRVVNEPTAAALAYGWSHEHPGIVAVFDFGGGTFDVSILRIQENVYEVLATAGDTHLGGDDFDHVLAEYGLQKIVDQHGEKANVLRPQNEEQRRQLTSRLLIESERVKRALTETSEAVFSIGDFSVPLSRSEAEPLWQPFVQRALDLCARALEDAHLKPADIEDVLLVGGSTCMPLVRRRAGEFFGREPNTQLNPEEAVALGAALQAEVLAGRGQDRLLLDVIPLSLGIETMGGVVSKLIHRNSTIPAEAREVYTNHAEKQTAFDIHVLQGERELVKDCRSLAQFKLRGLSPAPAGYHRVEVLFRIDANGILNVRATDLRSGKKHEIEVRPSFGISDEDLLKMLEASYEKAEEDIETRQLIDIRLEADTVIRACDKAIANAGHLVEPRTLSEIKARLIDLKNVVGGPSAQAIREAIENLDAVGRELAELQVNHALKEALSNKDVSKVEGHGRN